MLTERILEAASAHGYSASEQVISFARALIAAHEAKRPMPEGHVEVADQLVDELMLAVTMRVRNEVSVSELQHIRSNLLAHIGQPPAGMALVPEEPTEAMKRALFINLAKADDEAFVIKAIIAAAQKGKQ
ncbi:MAG: hypothetical protein ACRCWJ_14900 [Casimicrobium sp.]